MRFPTHWLVPTIATLILGFEPLTLMTGIANATSSHSTGSSPKIPTTFVTGQKNPVAIAQRRRPATAAQVEKFSNVLQVGMSAVRGCVTDRFEPDCRRLVNSKSSLQSWCFQGKSEACYMFRTLSSQEAYQNTSDALLESAQ